MTNKNEAEPLLPSEILNSRESLRLSQSSATAKRKISCKSSSSKENPSPLDFEAFLPWVCKQWQCPKLVTVIRLMQESYVNIEDRKASKKSQRTSRQLYQPVTGVRKSDALKAYKTSQITSLSITSQTTSLSKTSQITSSKTSEAVEDVFNKTVQESVIVTAYYDSKKRLVKVAFSDTSKVPRTVIQALSLCLPYHQFLTNLNFLNGLSSQNLYEISKLLPHSNLTEIRFRNCFIPEGNYHIILEQISDLKYLSLSRCSINDLVCKELVERLEVGMSGSPLLSLELDSNCITDIGAEYIAKVLRINRSLLHLNLSGNQLTDKGVDIILTQLAEFRLTAAETLERRQRKMKYFENKFAIYKRFSEDLQQKRVSMKSWSTNISFLRQKDSLDSYKSFGSRKPNDSITDLAESAAMDIVGEFTDPFEDTGIIERNGYPYYIGNQVLCSLNLAYNNLSYFSVKRIHEVLKYHQQIRQSFGKTGLLRIVFEGNSIPKTCVEYGEIHSFLGIKLDGAPSILRKNKV